MNLMSELTRFWSVSMTSFAARWGICASACCGNAESDREKEFASEFVDAMFELAEDWLAFTDF